MSIAERTPAPAGGYAIKPFAGRMYKPKAKNADAPPLALGAPKKLHDGYYDFGPVLSHNCVLNFIAGARGIGKTFGFKRLVIDAWIRKRDQFIYLRRFEEELKTIDQFFADIQHLYPQWDFRVDGRKFLVAPSSTRDDKKRDWEVIGFAMALSTAQNRKSVSYIRVKKVGFDEFILEKSAQHYLPNEAEILINFINTVDRNQDDTVFICMANAVTIDNPYFTYLKIIPPQADALKRKDYVKDKSPAKFWIAHFPDSHEFKNSIADTRYGQFIAGTAYYDYAVGNQFSDNHLHLVGDKSSDALHFFNLETRAGTMSVWKDETHRKWFVMSRVPTGRLMLTMMPEKMDETKTLVFPNDEIILQLMSAFRTRKVWFDNPATRNVFIDLFNGARR